MTKTNETPPWEENEEVVNLRHDNYSLMEKNRILTNQVVEARERCFALTERLWALNNRVADLLIKADVDA